jgi:hypothetical protein
MPNRCWDPCTLHCLLGAYHTVPCRQPATPSSSCQIFLPTTPDVALYVSPVPSRQVVKDRLLQQLQGAHNQLASKLLAAQQRLGRKDTLILAMQQQLAAAQMTLLDHNLDLPSSQAASGFACWGPEEEAGAAAGQGVWPAGAPSSTVCMAAAGLQAKAGPSAESAAAAAEGEEGGSSNWTSTAAAGGIISSGSSCSNDVAGGAGDQSPYHSHHHQQRSTSNGRGGAQRPWSASTAGSSISSARSARPSTAGGGGSSSQAPSEAVTVSAAVTAGPLSFTAAMDSRKWQRECRRLQWVMAQQAEQVRRRHCEGEGVGLAGRGCVLSAQACACSTYAVVMNHLLFSFSSSCRSSPSWCCLPPPPSLPPAPLQLEAARREAQKLQRQLSAHQASSAAALDAAAKESRTQRESLAGDLEGATTAMQDAVKRLAASEATRSALRQALDEEQRRVQQLTWDVAYLRQRAAAAKAAAGAQGRGADGPASSGPAGDAEGSSLSSSVTVP